MGSHVVTSKCILPHSQVQPNVILHCFFVGERMHLVIGCSFQFTTLHFGIATAPIEFVCVAPHSSVLRPLVIYYIIYLLAEIEAISGLRTETTLADKLLSQNSSQQNTSASLVTNSTMARVKYPHRRKVGYLRKFVNHSHNSNSFIVF